VTKRGAYVALVARQQAKTSGIGGGIIVIMSAAWQAVAAYGIKAAWRKRKHRENDENESAAKNRAASAKAISKIAWRRRVSSM